MATQKQITANRRNAQLCTGPKTAEGKRTVSKNALKHGLFSESTIEGEASESYEAYRAKIFKATLPRTDLEIEQVETMVRARWNQLRAWAIENSALSIRIRRNAESGPSSPGVISAADRAAEAFGQLADSSNILQLVKRYDVTFDRQYHRALSQLLLLREKGEIAEQNQLHL